MAEIANQGFVDTGLGGEVEVGDSPWCRDVREALAAFESSGFSRFHFDSQQLFEELGRVLLVLQRGVDSGG